MDVIMRANAGMEDRRIKPESSGNDHVRPARTRRGQTRTASTRFVGSSSGTLKITTNTSCLSLASRLAQNISASFSKPGAMAASKCENRTLASVACKEPMRDVYFTTTHWSPYLLDILKQTPQ